MTRQPNYRFIHAAMKRIGEQLYVAGVDGEVKQDINSELEAIGNELRLDSHLCPPKLDQVTVSLSDPMRRTPPRAASQEEH